MGQNRRRRRRGRMIRLGAAAAVLLLFLGCLALFQVRKVQVYGNSRHTSKEIASGLMDGILGKNTLYLLWKYRKGEVPDTAPYLETLHVQMKSPSQLEVHVTEKTLVAYLERDGYAYIDSEGVVLEITDRLYDDLPILTGLATEEPVLYQKLPVQSGAQLRTVLSLTQLLSYQGLSAEEIRFGDNMEITVFLGSIEIQLGQDEYLEEKIANLGKILPKLEGQSGILHLEGVTGRNEQIPFTPAGSEGWRQTEESEAGTDGSDTGTDGGADTGTDGGAGSGADVNGDGLVNEADSVAGQEEPDGGESPVIPMVFNSSGVLVYNVRIVNGTVVDEYGNSVPGVTVNEDGNVVDAYMNVIDPNTGDLVQ